MPTKEDLQKQISPNEFEFLESLLDQDQKSIQAQDALEFYEQDMQDRVEQFLQSTQDPSCQLIFNCGGGNIATNHLLEKLAQEITNKGEKFSAQPTAIIGFSDGTALPFYLIDKTDNVTLIQGTSIHHNSDYLKQKSDVSINLKKLNSATTSNLDASAIAISLHTSYNQMIAHPYVSKDLFDDKIVILESARDSQWREKINEMIDSKVFDNSKAIILGEFSQAILGDIDKAFKANKQHQEADLFSTNIAKQLTQIEEDETTISQLIKDNFEAIATSDQKERELKQQLIPIVLKSCFTTFTTKLGSKNPEIPIYQSSEEHAVFGHGCRRGEYISCGRCQITSEGQMTSHNGLREISQKSQTNLINLDHSDRSRTIEALDLATPNNQPQKSEQSWVEKMLNQKNLRAEKGQSKEL